MTEDLPSPGRLILCLAAIPAPRPILRGVARPPTLRRTVRLRGLIVAVAFLLPLTLPLFCIGRLFGVLRAIVLFRLLVATLALLLFELLFGVLRPVVLLRLFLAAGRTRWEWVSAV
jgi:hypothetical protein